MRLLLKTLTPCLFLVLSGCAAVTITQSGESNFENRPQYEESKKFYLWGLIGEHHINVKEICQDKAVKQMQTKFSSWDVLWSGLSLGLYLPRTAKVWCEEENK
jgi:hypothetical protein